MGITNYLQAPKGENKKRKRRGRGQGSGHGKTSCRGHKGQAARGMTKRTRGFEGGQMPLARRVPKRGFNNKFRKEFQVVNLESISALNVKEPVTPQVMREKGIIKKLSKAVKVLGNGNLKKSLEIHAHAFSASAKEAIEKAGGKAVVIA